MATQLDNPTRIALVCVQNAGRSQMAAAFARREVAARQLQDAVELHSGGTQPADEVHPGVVEAMAAVDIDIADRTPRAVTPAELQLCDYVVTMGCDASDVCPATWGGESRDWGLPDPDGKSAVRVAEIRDEVRRRVEALFDEIEAGS